MDMRGFLGRHVLSLKDSLSYARLSYTYECGTFHAYESLVKLVVDEGLRLRFRQAFVLQILHFLC